MNIQRIPSLLLVLLLFLIPACRGPGTAEGDFAIDLSVSPTPPAVGPARLTVRLTSESGDPVAGADVAIEGTMSHPGMNPERAETMEEVPGVYVAELFDFTMAGDWVLIVSAAHPDGRSATRTFPMRAVGAPVHEQDGS